VRIRRYSLRAGSGGAGAYRGGEGLVREYEMLGETSVTILSDRRCRPPYGLRGGKPGSVGRNTLVRNGREQTLPGKVQLELLPGDRLRIETPGGGGYGQGRHWIATKGHKDHKTKRRSGMQSPHSEIQ